MEYYIIKDKSNDTYLGLTLMKEVYSRNTDINDAHLFAEDEILNSKYLMKALYEDNLEIFKLSLDDAISPRDLFNLPKINLLLHVGNTIKYASYNDQDKLVWDTRDNKYDFDSLEEIEKAKSELVFGDLAVVEYCSITIIRH